ncbi:endonuclease [Geotalea uraniireducens]|uniref:Endonuclease n=1 Tax=Geotalea uraniireducens TaxID=351604 RepID=A0ABM8EN08_9BACT|nr:endonuclease/exonuclease/phosphatase family protein [Geotalea uraniireducens]BDV43828.1 endonuclease [Geotalea uraniireducens]
MNAIRVMTYNIHRGTGEDRRHAPERVAEVVAGLRPDIVALQEVDCGQLRPALRDQAALVAERLALAGAPFRIERERCGNVILSRFPMTLVQAGGLRRSRRWRTPARRGALWVEIEAAGQNIQVINTHLGLTPRDRLAQAKVLTGPEWLGNPACRPPVILCGDFNAQPGSPVHRLLDTRFVNAESLCPGCRVERTWPSRRPLLRIDHLFVSPGVVVEAIEVPAAGMARVASDHLPLLAVLMLPESLPA